MPETDRPIDKNEASKIESAPKPTGDEQQASLRRQPLSDEEQASPRRDPIPQHSSPVISPNTAEPPPKEKRLQKVCIIRDTSGDSPNISLNCHPPAKDGELWIFAALGIVLQLGVLLYSGLATYHRALSLQKDGKPIAGYAYPCTAGGTLVLVAGMFLCSWVVESSTIENRYEAGHKAGEGWKTRIVWLQQTKTVSDQVFESCMVYAKDDRQTITTSRRIQRCDKDDSTGLQLKVMVRTIIARCRSVLPFAGPSTLDASKRLGDKSDTSDESSVGLELKTIFGTIIALCGFVLQFAGLRGMHWSASVAQLGAVVVMVGVKAWVRRGLTKTPSYEALTSGFELDSFVKTLGDIQRESWSGSDKGMPSGSKQSSNDWIVVTGGESSLVAYKQTPPSTLSSKDGVSNAQTVLNARKQLARLAGWRGPASSEAVSLARAIERTIDQLDARKCLPDTARSGLTWNFEARYIRSQPQTISIRLLHEEGMDGKWMQPRSRRHSRCGCPR
jgi:hypothetical protein